MLDELERLAAEDAQQRRAWLQQHSAAIGTVLDTPNLNAVDSRLFRARYWQDGQLIVATMLQLFRQPDGLSRVNVYAVRGYNNWPGHAPKLELTGKYSCDDIVAFLRLDMVDPAGIEWRDETAYIIVPDTVDAIIRKATS